MAPSWYKIINISKGRSRRHYSLYRNSKEVQYIYRHSGGDKPQLGFIIHVEIDSITMNIECNKCAIYILFKKSESDFSKKSVSWRKSGWIFILNDKLKI